MLTIAGGVILGLLLLPLVIWLLGFAVRLSMWIALAPIALIASIWQRLGRRRS